MAEAHASAATKRCTVCNVEKPLDGFHRTTGGALGRKANCKDCHRARWSRAAGYVPPSAVRLKIESAARLANRCKKCAGCTELRPVSEFTRMKSRRIRDRCERCRNRKLEFVQPTEKACTGCGQTKSVDEFYWQTDKRRLSRPRRPAAQCKACWTKIPSRGTDARRSENAARAQRAGRLYKPNPNAWKKNQPSPQEKALRRTAIAVGSTIRAWQRFCGSGRTVEEQKRANRLAFQRRYRLHREAEIRRSRDGKRMRRESLSRAGLTQGDIATIRTSSDECEYCGRSVAGCAHVDHIVPLSQGGTSDPGNLAVVCAECNLSKATSSIYVWAKAQPSHVQARVALLST